MTDVLRQIVVDELYKGRTIDEIADDITKLMNQGVKDYEELTKKPSPEESRKDYLKNLEDFLIDLIYERDIDDGWLSAAWAYYWGMTNPELTKEDLEEIEEMTKNVLADVGREMKNFTDELNKFIEKIENPKEVKVKGTNKDDEEIVRKFLQTILG